MASNLRVMASNLLPYNLILAENTWIRYFDVGPINHAASKHDCFGVIWFSSARFSAPISLQGAHIVNLHVITLLGPGWWSAIGF